MCVCAMRKKFRQGLVKQRERKLKHFLPDLVGSLAAETVRLLALVLDKLALGAGEATTLSLALPRL